MRARPPTRFLGHLLRPLLGLGLAAAGLAGMVRAAPPAQATAPPHPAAPARAAALPQADAPAPLDLDALFARGAWDADSLGPFRWLNEHSYARVEPSRTIAGAQEVARYDAATGARTLLVSAEQITPGVGHRGPLRIDDYAVSPDGDAVLLYTNARRVWRRRTRGDYWLLDLRDGRLRQIGGTGREAVLQFAKFSPDSTRVAFVLDHDLFVQDLRTDTITRLTTDGSPTLVNATGDWVYEEELGLRDGYRWSPDGKAIAFWQIDDELVREFVLVDYLSELYPILKRFPYPKAGEINPAARVGIVPAGGGEIRWVALPGSPRDNYVARMQWAPDGRQLAIQYLNRRQDLNRLLLADARTGKVRAVLRETDEAWVDVGDDFRWLDGGRAFLWSSERDGWRRLYRVSRDGTSLRPLTPAGMDVLGVEALDEARGWLYFAAAPNPTQRHLYRVPLAGPAPAAAAVERLSPDGGWHTYSIAPGAGYALHTASAFVRPPRVEIVELPAHEVRQTLVDNARLRERVAALAIDAEFFRVEVEPGVQLDAWMIRPPELDPRARYPLLVYVYGEPAGQTVLDRWGGRRTLWHELLARQGYIVASIDNRGTPAPRGRAWRKVIYGEVGTLASADQAAAVRRILEQRPYVDPDRIGVWGWSGGGSMTLNALFRYPELYRVGMAVAPVPDQRYYDTIYQERYMGRPQDNPEGYRRGSPITYASALRGELLLVHGTGDDNVHYQGTAALVDRLVAAGKQFAMMAYPNRTHAIAEGAGTRRHLYGLLTRFLHEHLPAGPRRADTTAAGASSPGDRSGGR